MNEATAVSLDTSIESLKASLDGVRALSPVIDAAVELLAGCLRAGGKLLVCGNGGSASDASHFASEFVGRFIADRRSWPAIPLAADSGVMTGIGNDYGYREVFARQVRGYGREGDVLVVFSSSGNSENIVAALAAARECGIKSLAFLGREGGQCAGMATVELIVPGTVTARIQETQKFLLHIVCERVEAALPQW